MGSGDTHTEVVCLVDGEHEYNHTINEQHTVEVVGYAESGVHEEAGGTTQFVIGACVDTLIRVTTTSAAGGSTTMRAAGDVSLHVSLRFRLGRQSGN